MIKDSTAYLKKEDLKIGMEITAKQLDRVYDLYVVINKAELVIEKYGSTWKGTITEISKDELCAAENDEVLIYNDSLKAMENGTYYGQE